MKVKSSPKKPLKQSALPYNRPAPSQQAVEDEVKIYFPLTADERAKFRRDDNTKLTAKQWAALDLCRRIPRGQVLTYKEMSRLLDTCPRAIGGMMRKNPFAPLVPCHRIIASNGFIGGFAGSWEKDGASALQQKKRKLLESENVFFDSKGYLRGPATTLWRGD